MNEIRWGTSPHNARPILAGTAASMLATIMNFSDRDEVMWTAEWYKRRPFFVAMIEWRGSCGNDSGTLWVSTRIVRVPAHRFAWRWLRLRLGLDSPLPRAWLHR